METPPRAWGRPISSDIMHLLPGNTPTGVGKTIFWPVAYLSKQKHPHGRGEDKPQLEQVTLSLETPPRAWGRLLLIRNLWPIPRNTPTGVGKTISYCYLGCLLKKHPHGRGEDLFPCYVLSCTLETPPRAWGRPTMGHSPMLALRNTPTGVGKTSWAAWRRDST